MRSPPEGIEVGDTLTQDEIEDAYNTSFGYRISGINPRRDDHDRRYILLFANEDGPYSDSVTQGRFEYIGEGLSGDQSEDSPGNSALIDACSSGLPVHFFYKRADGEDWKYQGIVDVVDYERRNQGGRKVFVFTMEHRHRIEGGKDTEGYETFQLEKKPDSGETFTAEIDRISDSGNGIVETQEGHINIGPIREDAVGEEITAEMENSTFARCLTKEVRIDDYEIEFDLLLPLNNQSYFSNSLPPVDNRETTQIAGPTFCNECGSLMYPSGEGRRVCSSCGYKKSVSTDETETKSDTTDESGKKENDRVPIEKDNPESPNKPSSEQAETTSLDPDSSTDTSELRKKAVESAVEEVPEEASTVQHETPTYNRSQAVKEYVKARAGGICEGCGEPAPFTSKTGEPYLHAHHIHELSDGGSDTPDTVVALCPNCHYQVHHGEDGDEYNQELLEVVQDKENSNE